LRMQKEMETAEKSRVVESRVPKLDIGGLKKGSELERSTERAVPRRCETGRMQLKFHGTVFLVASS